MVKYDELVGQKFQRLTVRKYLGRQKGRQFFIAECECGKQTRVSYDSLKKNESCGCARTDYIKTGKFARGLHY